VVAFISFATTHPTATRCSHRFIHRKVQQSGAKFLYQDASSHRYYIFNGIVFSVPYHSAKEVPIGTYKRILKIIKEVK